MTHNVDSLIAQLRSHAPPGTEVPQLLQKFVEWHTSEGESLGYFSVLGDRLDDFYVEDGSRQASTFYSFLRCADGSMIGWWRPEGEPLADSSIVLLGAEGELAAVGLGLEDFLLRWVDGSVSVPDLMLDPDDSNYQASVAARRRLGIWLASLGLSRDTTPKPLLDRSGQLEAWFGNWSHHAQHNAKNNENRIVMATCLREAIGLPKEPWQRNFIDAIVTSHQCQLYRTYVGQRPLECPQSLESAIRDFRDQDARELPEAGLWFRAALELSNEGVLTVKRTYLDLPNPEEIQFDLRGVLEDMERMPRSPYWTPSWLTS